MRTFKSSPRTHVQKYDPTYCQGNISIRGERYIQESPNKSDIILSVLFDDSVSGLFTEPGLYAHHLLGKLHKFTVYNLRMQLIVYVLAL